MSRPTTAHRRRFEAGQRAFVSARERAEKVRAHTRARCGEWRVTLMNRGEEETLRRALAAEDRALDRVLTVLGEVSPRDFRGSCPVGFIGADLTWEDAITDGPLSVIPPAPYGRRQADMERFATEVLS